METIHRREAWNKGKLVGQKPLLKPKDIRAIRIHLQSKHAVRDLAMFNLVPIADADERWKPCDCVFHTKLDTDSKRIWTVIPRQTGH